MNVTMECRLDPKRPGVVYAKITGEDGEMMVSARLDYCISAAQGRGYVITNAQEVLFWLHTNSEFKGY